MLKTKPNMFRRTLSMLLAVVILIGMVPPNVFSIEAKSNDYIPGDVNGDGKILLNDYLMSKRIEAGTKNADENMLARTDINGDGKINKADYEQIKNIILGE